MQSTLKEGVGNLKHSKAAYGALGDDRYRCLNRTKSALSAGGPCRLAVSLKHQRLTSERFDIRIKLRIRLNLQAPLPSPEFRQRKCRDNSGR